MQKPRGVDRPARTAHLPLDGTTQGLTFKPFSAGCSIRGRTYCPRANHPSIRERPAAICSPPIRAIVTATELATYLYRRWRSCSLASIVRSITGFPTSTASGADRAAPASSASPPIIRQVFGRAFMMIAIRIRSDRLRACSFSIMCARCNSTVRKLMPR